MGLLINDIDKQPHQPTFSTGLPSKNTRLDDGTHLRADTLKERIAQSTSYPHFRGVHGGAAC